MRVLVNSRQGVVVQRVLDLWQGDADAGEEKAKEAVECFGGEPDGDDVASVFRKQCFDTSTGDISGVDCILLDAAHDAPTIARLIEMVRLGTPNSALRVVLLTSFASWGGKATGATPMLEGQSFRQRVPLSKELSPVGRFALENSVWSLGGDKNPNLSAVVVGVGLLYGGAGYDMEQTLCDLWNPEPNRQVAVPASSSLSHAPAIHIEDCVRGVSALCDPSTAVPDSGFVAMVDGSEGTTTEALQCAADVVGAGAKVSVGASRNAVQSLWSSSAVASTAEQDSKWLVDVKLSADSLWLASASSESGEPLLRYRGGWASNTRELMAEFQRAQRLAPMRVWIVGPPGIATEQAATAVSGQLQLPVVDFPAAVSLVVRVGEVVADQKRQQAEYDAAKAAYDEAVAEAAEAEERKEGTGEDEGEGEAKGEGEGKGEEVDEGDEGGAKVGEGKEQEDKQPLVEPEVPQFETCLDDDSRVLNAGQLESLHSIFTMISAALVENGSVALGEEGELPEGATWSSLAAEHADSLPTAVQYACLREALQTSKCRQLGYVCAVPLDSREEVRTLFLQEHDELVEDDNAGGSNGGDAGADGAAADDEAGPPATKKVALDPQDPSVVSIVPTTVLYVRCSDDEVVRRSEAALNAQGVAPGDQKAPLEQARTALAAFREAEVEPEPTPQDEKVVPGAEEAGEKEEEATAAAEEEEAKAGSEEEEKGSGGQEGKEGDAAAEPAKPWHRSMNELQLLYSLREPSEGRTCRTTVSYVEALPPPEPAPPADGEEIDPEQQALEAEAAATAQVQTDAVAAVLDAWGESPGWLGLYPATSAGATDGSSGNGGESSSLAPESATSTGASDGAGEGLEPLAAGDAANDTGKGGVGKPGPGAAGANSTGVSKSAASSGNVFDLVSAEDEQLLMERTASMRKFLIDTGALACVAAGLIEIRQQQPRDPIDHLVKFLKAQAKKNYDKAREEAKAAFQAEYEEMDRESEPEMDSEDDGLDYDSEEDGEPSTTLASASVAEGDND